MDGRASALTPAVFNVEATANDSDSHTWLKDMERRCTQMRNGGPERLGGFYDEDLRSFVVVPSSDARLSVPAGSRSLRGLRAEAGFV